MPKPKFTQEQIAYSLKQANCWDNSVVESFFHALKGGLIHHADYPTRAQTRTEIFEFIGVFYNRARRHSKLDHQAPPLYEWQNHR